MSAVRVLWIDLRCQSHAEGLACLAPRGCLVTQVESIPAASRAIREAPPDVACIEFDYPVESRLSVVPKIRRGFPSLPVLMFTEYHSEALAVQAFRWGVRDYRVKPVSAAMLARGIGFAAGGSVPRGRKRDRNGAMPLDLIAPGGHLLAPVVTAVRTAAALAYIADHYAEPVARPVMAARCHLSLSEFSRAFRREHEITFERYLLEFRIGKARELLLDSRLTITQIAHAVGFNDSSYFARAFRLLAGVSASDWRRGAHRLG